MMCRLSVALLCGNVIVVGKDCLVALRWCMRGCAYVIHVGVGADLGVATQQKT